MAREKSFEEKLKDHIKASGGWVVKVHADIVQGKGTLDLIGSYKGQPFMVECKSDAGKPSRVQLYLAKRAMEGGYASGVVSNIKGFEQLFRDVRKKAKKRDAETFPEPVSP